MRMNQIVWIFESEARTIAFEAGKWKNRETGGDLYGLWTAHGIPVIYLATGPGPEAQGQWGKYRMDINYRNQCEEYLYARYGIHYLGDWHSHHSIGLYNPSSGDQMRIQKICDKNRISQMAEIIVNHQQGGGVEQEELSGFIYKDCVMSRGNIQILGRKTSPIRQEEKKMFGPSGKMDMTRIVLNPVNWSRNETHIQLRKRVE